MPTHIVAIPSPAHFHGLPFPPNIQPCFKQGCPLPPKALPCLPTGVAKNPAPDALFGDGLPDHVLACSVSDLCRNFTQVFNIVRPRHHRYPIPLGHYNDETYLKTEIQVQRRNGKLCALGGRFNLNPDLSKACVDFAAADGIEPSVYVYGVITKPLDSSEGFCTSSWPWQRSDCTQATVTEIVGRQIQAGNLVPWARSAVFGSDGPPGLCSQLAD